jgi:hypothetical protein
MCHRCTRLGRIDTCIDRPRVNANGNKKKSTKKNQTKVVATHEIETIDLTTIPQSSAAAETIAEIINRHIKRHSRSNNNNDVSSETAQLVVHERTPSRSPARKKERHHISGSSSDSSSSSSDDNHSSNNGRRYPYRFVEGTLASSSLIDGKTLLPWNGPSTHMTRLGSSNEGELYTENQIVREALNHLMPWIRHMNENFSPMATELVPSLLFATDR